MRQTKAKTKVSIPLLILLALTVASRNLYAQSRLPTAPAVPTNEDCEEFANACLKLYQDSTQRDFSCMRGPANWGPGFDVGDLDCRPNPVPSKPWPQCDAGHLASCQLNKRILDEEQACFARVPHNSSSAGIDSSRYMSARANLISTMRVYSKTLQVVNDPNKAIFEAINAHSPTYAGKMFDSQGQVRPKYSMTMNEIYNFAENYAKYGMKQGLTEELSREIAIQSLEQIGNQFRANLAALNQAVSDIQSLQASPTSNNNGDMSGVY